MTTNQQPPLWKYIPLSEFKPLSSSMSQTVQKGLRGFLQRLFSKEEEAPEPLQQELSMLTDEVLEQVAPLPDWLAPVPALQEALGDWCNGKSNVVGDAAFVVGLPQSGNAETLRGLAASLSWRVIEPPDHTSILQKDRSWFEHFSEAEGPWVLPALELCYLRHVGGLWLVRELLDQLACGALGRGVIGCDAWAWAYLKHVWQGELTPAWILRPFEQVHIERWLLQLLEQGQEQRPLFRDNNDGGYILPPAPSKGEDTFGEKEKSHFLHELALYSRGCPGIVHATWRRALRDLPESPEQASDDSKDANPSDLADEVKEPQGPDDGGSLPSAQDATLGQLASPQRTYWVVSVESIVPAPLSPMARSERALLLQTLLLHGPLQAETLTQLVPVSLSSTIQTLSVLKHLGYLSLEQGVWSISAHALPVIRQFLEDRGHLVDEC